MRISWIRRTGAITDQQEVFSVWDVILNDAIRPSKTQSTDQLKHWQYVEPNIVYYKTFQISQQVVCRCWWPYWKGSLPCAAVRLLSSGKRR